MILIVRNKVEDYERWKQVFDLDAARAAAAGLDVIKMWRDVEDANNVFFMMTVESKASALAFMNDPASADTGKRSGVIDGDAYFLEEID